MIKKINKILVCTLGFQDGNKLEHMERKLEINLAKQYLSDSFYSNGNAVYYNHCRVWTFSGLY